MSVTATTTLLLVLSLLGGWLGYRRALMTANGRRRILHSLPRYHGLWVALCMLLPSTAFLLVALMLRNPVIDWLLWESLPPDLITAKNPDLYLVRLKTIATEGALFDDVTVAERTASTYFLRLRLVAGWVIGIGSVALAASFGLNALRRVAQGFRARNFTDRIMLGVLAMCSVVAMVTTVGIVFSLLAESLRFFAVVSPIDFLFGLEWSPQTAIRAEQLELAPTGAFGVIPVFAGSLLIASVAMAVAGPVGLLAAIYMVEFADDRVRSVSKPVIELLAGVPTVVYGFFAAVTVAPIVREAGAALGLEVSSQSAIAAGGVMGLMIIPFVSSLSDDALSAVPKDLREGAYSLGATQSETIYRVVLPAALPGLLSAFVLAVSRALGETMIVVMAAGIFANLTLNPFESVTTVTVQITSVLTGDQPFDSATTLSAFALSLTLFVVTLILNLIGLKVMQRYHEQYR